jgi:hypothetical protein
MMRKLMLLMAVMMAVVALPAQEQAPPPPFYGLYVWCSTLSSRDWLMGRIKEVGFKIISSAIEVDEKTDEGMRQCARNGIQVVGIYGPNRFVKEMDLDGWRAGLKQRVERYGPGGSFWKENPDLPANPIFYWSFASEPGTEMKPPGEMLPDEAYCKFMQAGYEVVKGYNRNLVVVAMSPTGGFAGIPSMTYVDPKRKIMGPQAFTEGVHARGGAKYYDVYDLHCFTFPMPPDTGGTAPLLKWLNSETGKYGKPKPVWFVDWGFPMAYGLERPFHLTKDQSADYALRGLLLSAAHGVQTITYTYYGDQFSKTGQKGKGLRYKGYGIFTRDGNLRIQAKTIKLMIDLIPDRPKLLEKICDGQNPDKVARRSSDRPYPDSPFYCYKFKGVGDDEVLVAWTEGRPFKYTFKVNADKVAFYNRELLGGVVYSKKNGSIRDNGEITLPVTGTPFLLSNRVTPGQEKATVDYLRPVKYSSWRPIHGAEE